jgi:Putative metallopeptidase family (DUF6782)
MHLSRRTTCRRVGQMALIGWLVLCVLALPAAHAQPGTSGPIAAGAQHQALGAALEPERAARIRRIIAAPEEACLAAGAHPGTTAPQVAIERAAASIALSRVGAWLLHEAGARRVLICLDPATELAAYYRAELRLIGLQAQLEAPAKAVFLAHELAHVLQHPRYSNSRDFPLEDLILMHRMREATAEAVATRVLWQMRAAGRPEPWQAKLGTGYRDIAHAFAETMAGMPDGGAAGRELVATRAAFDRWFAWPERLRQYDDHMLDHIERIAHDQLGLTAPRRTLTDDFLRGLGWYAGETFIAGARRPLVGAYYRSGLSPENAARLAAVLGEGAERLASDAAAWQDGAAPERAGR